MPTNEDRTYILLLPKRAVTPKLFKLQLIQLCSLSVNRLLFKGFVSFKGSEDLFFYSGDRVDKKETLNFFNEIVFRKTDSI